MFLFVSTSPYFHFFKQLSAGTLHLLQYSFQISPIEVSCTLPLPFSLTSDWYLQFFKSALGVQVHSSSAFLKLEILLPMQRYGYWCIEIIQGNISAVKTAFVRTISCAIFVSSSNRTTWSESQRIGRVTCSDFREESKAPGSYRKQLLSDDNVRYPLARHFFVRRMAQRKFWQNQLWRLNSLTEGIP